MDFPMVFFAAHAALYERTMGTSMEKRLFFSMGKPMVFLLGELAHWKKDHGLSHGLFSYGQKFSTEIPMVFVSDGLFRELL